MHGAACLSLCFYGMHYKHFTEQTLGAAVFLCPDGECDPYLAGTRARKELGVNDKVI